MGESQGSQFDERAPDSVVDLGRGQLQLSLDVLVPVAPGDPVHDIRLTLGQFLPGGKVSGSIHCPPPPCRFWSSVSASAVGVSFWGGDDAGVFMVFFQLKSTAATARGVFADAFGVSCPHPIARTSLDDFGLPRAIADKVPDGPDLALAANDASPGGHPRVADGTGCGVSVDGAHISCGSSRVRGGMCAFPGRR